MSGRTEIALYDVDRARLRELGSLLDRLDAALGDRDQVASVLTSARLAYLGGFCAGLADREPEEDRLRRGEAGRSRAESVSRAEALLQAPREGTDAPGRSDFEVAIRDLLGVIEMPL